MTIAYRFESVMEGFRDEIVPQRISCIRPILDGWISQTVANRQALEVDLFVAMYFAVFVQGKADSWDIMPAAIVQNVRGACQFQEKLCYWPHLIR